MVKILNNVKNICPTHSITIPSIGKPCPAPLAFMLVFHKLLYKMFENFHDCQTCHLLDFYEIWYQPCSVIQSSVFVQCQQVKKARNDYWTIVFVTCMIIYMWKYRPVSTTKEDVLCRVLVLLIHTLFLEPLNILICVIN